MAKRQPMTLKIHGDWEAVAEKLLNTPANSTPVRVTEKRKTTKKKKAPKPKPGAR